MRNLIFILLSSVMHVAVQAAETAPAEAITGTWHGQLDVGMAELTLVFHIQSDEDGDLVASVDSPDQGATGIPVDRAAFENNVLILDLSGIGARYEGELSDGNTLSGVWQQGGQRWPLVMKSGGSSESRARPQTPEPPFPYRQEEVVFTHADAGIQLAGTLTLPAGDGPFPAAVLIHGSGAHDRDETIFGHQPFWVLADYLARRGIAVLRYDKRGTAASEGVFAAATIADFAGDATAALSFLEPRPDIGAVGLIGHSEGGTIAAMVAADSDAVAFVVLLAASGLTGEALLYLQNERLLAASGVGDELVAWQLGMLRATFGSITGAAGDEHLHAVLAEAFDTLPAHARATLGVEEKDQWIEDQAAAMTTPWMRHFLVHDPRADLRRVRAPVLALNGELDLQVPPTENLAAIEAALAEGGNTDVTVRELPGLNHLFQTANTGLPLEYGQIEETFAPAALEIIAEWILERSN